MEGPLSVQRSGSHQREGEQLCCPSVEFQRREFVVWKLGLTYDPMRSWVLCHPQPMVAGAKSVGEVSRPGVKTWSILGD